MSEMGARDEGVLEQVVLRNVRGLVQSAHDMLCLIHPETQGLGVVLDHLQAAQVALEGRESVAIECRTCGEEFDPADLGAVLLHEHRGLTDEPGLREMLGGVEPGEEV